MNEPNSGNRINEPNKPNTGLSNSGISGSGISGSGMRENSTKERLRDKMGEARDSLADMGTLAKETVADKFQDLKSRATEQYERGKEKVQEWEDSLVRTVRSSPMKSVLVAAGIGLAFGFLFRGRSH